MPQRFEPRTSSWIDWVVLGIVIVALLVAGVWVEARRADTAPASEVLEQPQVQ